MSDLNTIAAEREPGRVQSFLNRIIDVRRGELAILGWSWLYIFSVLSAYYILRPIRDEMGVAGGVENLQWLFTGTLLGMILVNPPFAALVARLPRVRFISIAYRFFIAQSTFVRVAPSPGNCRAKHLGRPRLLYLDLGFQSLCRVRVLGPDGGCFQL